MEAGEALLTPTPQQGRGEVSGGSRALWRLSLGTGSAFGHCAHLGPARRGRTMDLRPQPGGEHCPDPPPPAPAELQGGRGLAPVQPDIVEGGSLSLTREPPSHQVLPRSWTRQRETTVRVRAAHARERPHPGVPLGHGGPRPEWPRPQNRTSGGPLWDGLPVNHRVP